MLKIIKQEVEARENTFVNPTRSTSHSVHPPVSHNPTGSSLVINSSNVSCVYCHQNHFSASCTKVVNLKDRKDIFMKSGRCYNCLRISHKSKDCDSSQNCRCCHRQSICEQCPTIKHEHVTPDKGGVIQPNTDQQFSVNNFSSQADGKRVVLLQLLRDRATIPVRVLLDNGSQLSYITTSVKTKLKLKLIRQKKVVPQYFWKQFLHYKRL